MVQISSQTCQNNTIDMYNGMNQIPDVNNYAKI